MEREGTDGIYLYCLARARDAVRPALAARRAAGVDDRYPVETLEGEGVLAVVGTVHPEDFHERNLETLEWIGPRACRHERVIEAVMEASPVLPVRFGTIFRSRDKVERFLARHHRAVLTFFDELGDRAEWGVKLYLDEAVARCVVAAEDPAIRAGQAGLPASPGARYLRQKQIEAVIDKALRRWTEEVARGVHDHLSAHATGGVALPLLSGAATGRVERLVLNGSYLLPRAEVPRFLSAVSAQAARHRPYGLTMEVRGPWPPYNFCPSLAGGEAEDAAAAAPGP